LEKIRLAPWSTQNIAGTDPQELAVTRKERQTSKDRQAASSDEARTGDHADAKREELAKQAEKGLRKASRGLESDGGDATIDRSEGKS
jgi:hypothetical protein